MIYDVTTSQILENARQHRTEVVGDFMRTRVGIVALAAAFGALVVTAGYGLVADMQGAAPRADATDVGSP